MKAKEDKLIESLNMIDYLVLKVIDLCFKYYQWKIDKFIPTSNRKQRAKIWQNLVKSHFLIKSKTILGYHNIKHSLECADLCQEAEDIVNPQPDINIKL